MRTLPLTLAAALIAAGCSSPPKLPRATGAFKPANDAEYIEALKLRMDMENARRELELARRSADARNMMLQTKAPPMMQPATLRATRAATPVDATASGANVIFTIRFATGATRPALTPDALKALVVAAKAAPLVRVNGRTDASAFTAANDRIARLRAQETAALLIRQGVEPRRINVSWMAAGNTVTSNDTPSGRDLNRRVEVEVYATDPMPAVSAQGDTSVAAK
jgi:outer membrane protein OmpA-like peptidoglycan-associated protein